MIAARVAWLSPPQRAISSSVRPQPVHSPRPLSIVQTLMQGVRGVWSGEVMTPCGAIFSLSRADPYEGFIEKR